MLTHLTSSLSGAAGRTSLTELCALEKLSAVLCYAQPKKNC